MSTLEPEDVGFDQDCSYEGRHFKFVEKVMSHSGRSLLGLNDSTWIMLLTSFLRLDLLSPLMKSPTVIVWMPFSCVLGLFSRFQSLSRPYDVQLHPSTESACRFFADIACLIEATKCDAHLVSGRERRLVVVIGSSKVFFIGIQ